MKRRDFSKKAAESDEELLKRQEVMFRLDQLRNREIEGASEEQIQRFQAALADFRSKSDQVRRFEESVEAARQNLQAQKGLGMTRVSEVLADHGDSYEGPDDDPPPAEVPEEDEPPPAEVS